VPAVATDPQKGDWRLTVTAETHGTQVVPMFTVADPDGNPKGTTQGTPVDAALWASGDRRALDAAASAGGDAVATLLTRIEAQRRQNDPNSLVNRPARVLVPEVSGAPGDGNHALARQMRAHLPEVGEVVTDKPETADFAVKGEVKLATTGEGQRVEIQWIVLDAAGRELGRVVQLNDIARGSLDGLWGDVALVVAQQAAAGVRDVILNNTGRRATAPAAAN